MTKRLMALLLAVVLLCTTGCSGILEREYEETSPHSETPKVTGDSDALRVENYQELVNALLYLVTRGNTAGTIHLYYTPDESATSDLSAACREVMEEDPLGAYSVDGISFENTTIVAYDQVDVEIRYRRTQEQVASITMATGTANIRNQLAESMSEFSRESVLRLSYFSGDEQTIQGLIEQAYYEIPAAAMGMPEAEITLYPESGLQKIAEIKFTYPLGSDAISQRVKTVENRVTVLLSNIWGSVDDVMILELAQQVLNCGLYQPEGGDTPYAAIVEGDANSEGMAMAMLLLCQRMGITCQVVVGTKNGEEHAWNVILTDSGYRHFDLSTVQGGLGVEDESVFFSDRTAAEEGYRWDALWVPPCGDPAV